MGNKPRVPKSIGVDLPDDLRGVWQSQPCAGGPMLLDEIHARARELERRIRRRNAREYIAAVMVFVAFGFYIYRFTNPLVRIGSGLVIAGTACAMYSLRRRTAPATLPADLGRVGSLEFHRRELERQCQALNSMWKWYLAPLLPGLAVFAFAGGARKAVVQLVLVAAVFVWVWRLNRRAARRLEWQIAELDHFDNLEESQ